jgi:VanZ family protein
MGVIFALSAETGTESSGLSGAVVDVVTKVTGAVGLHPDHDTLQLVVRKLAHFSAYLILGALAIVAWRRWPGARAARSGRRVRWDLIGPALIAIAYAGTDEAHQLLVTGRSGQVTDVLIDSAGVLVGVWLVALARRSAKSEPDYGDGVTDNANAGGSSR